MTTSQSQSVATVTTLFSPRIIGEYHNRKISGSLTRAVFVSISVKSVATEATSVKRVASNQYLPRQPVAAILAFPYKKLATNDEGLSVWSLQKNTQTLNSKCKDITIG